MSAEFTKIISDFVRDILITFPEYSRIISGWWSLEVDANNNTEYVFNHCTRVFKDHFFNILNKNEEIMTDDSFNTEFLPGIVFKYIWKCDISDATRDTIWKYLQLILFSIVGDLHTKSDENIFNGIDDGELKEKLAETFEQMKSLFDEHGQTKQENQEQGGHQGPETPSAIPNVDEHIKNLMKGKLGKLAMEFAEETVKDMDIDIENATNTNDAFQKMFKNPSNLMSVVKNVGEKLDSKIKSGEIKESEILAEGMDLLNNMKNIPGMENMQSMFASMGLGKMSQGATNSRLQQNLKMAQMRERMRKKQQEQQSQQMQQQQPQQPQQSQQMQEKQVPDVGMSSENKKKKKNKSKK